MALTSREFPKDSTENGPVDVLWEDGERLYRRMWRDMDGGDRREFLVVQPCVEHPTLGTINRLTHEYNLKDYIDHPWAVRPLELLREHGQTSLVLESTRARPLGETIGSGLPVGRFLRLAVTVTNAVAGLHQSGLVHKDIKASNILIEPETGKACLTGFGFASRLPRERPMLEPPELIAGTLSHMSPEQTGRMNRSIDSRSDLYSLGITLYQALTGSLPFHAKEPMEWVHCHIARTPPAPKAALEEIPPQVSAIVMKLLAKTPEERYQTAGGVERDLRRCLDDWETGGVIVEFSPGKRDHSDRLLIPEKLYGRAREVETLVSAFDRVVQNGLPELVLVSGYSGIGKSSVVNELHKVLVPLRGLFAAGKFDQYKRDIPYSTLAQALRSLVHWLLAKSDIELGSWREALRDGLGPNGQLMVDLVPELKLIIGEQPPVPHLQPQDEKRRFQLVFRRFLAVFARPEHPLALFLDDLQWLDAATLDLLEDLVMQPDVRHVLFIGAYRDNEVASDHPLVRAMGRIRSAGTPIRGVVLTRLAQEHVEQLLADSLHCDDGDPAQLAELVLQKTGGNPFFVIQFISALVDQSLLTFDSGAARWSWDLPRIHAKGYTDNVVDLMIDKLTGLPLRTQMVLQQLACLGNSAEFTRLAAVYGDSDEELRHDLQEALRTDLVIHAEGSYHFLHDRVQEAAYSLIPEKQRAAAHLRIGRLLLAHTAAEKREEAIFEIVNQLDQAVELISSRAEKEQLAELNLIAGNRAKASTAYASALKYFIAGASLLLEEGWEHRNELIFALELHRAECEFLTGELAAAETRLTALSLRCEDSVEQATIACLRIDLYTTLDQNERAVDVCLAYMHYLGIEWSSHPTEEQARREYERTWSLFGGREIEALIDLPVMSDPAVVATQDVLTKALTPALYTNANLLSLIVCQIINLSLEHGNSDGSCLGYVWLGRVAGYRFGNYQAGFRLGKLGYDLVERCGFERFRARTYISFGNFCMAWARPVRAARDMLRRAFDAANANGDVTHGAFSSNNLIANLLAAGDPLFDVQSEAERGLAFAQRARFGAVIDLITTQLCFIRTLRGLTSTFGCFNDAQFDELQFERRLSSGSAQGAPIAACRYWIRKLQARFLAGEFVAAVDASFQVQRLLWTTPSVLEVAEGYFYGALSHAASADPTFPVQFREHVDALSAHHKQLEELAENCRENFQNRALLVGAEIARIQGRDLDAERLYEAAINSARDNGFIHNEALANELAAHFYGGRGFQTIARAYLQNARYGYLRWGADGKVRQLDQLYPYLKSQDAGAASTHTIATPLEQLDLATILEVSRAVQGETDPEKLIETVMRLCLEHAGASRGLLILPQGDEYQIAAEARISSERVTVDLRQASIGSDELSLPVLQYVLRTRQRIVLQDAAGASEFAYDDYLQHNHARSVLCIPLLKQTRLVGIVYLENNLVSAAFTPSRITLLEVLASDAAISLENALLYHDLGERKRELRLIINTIPTHIYVLNTEGCVQYVNEAVMDYTGLTLEDVQQQDYRDRVIQPEDLESVRARRAASLRCAAPFSTEQRVLRKDGQYRWFLVRYNPLLDERGRIIRWYVAASDIEDRKRAEARVEQAYLRLAEAQRLSKTGSFITNLVTDDHNNWSEEVFRIFEFDPATKVTVQTIRAFIHPEDLPSFDDMIVRSVTSADLDFVFRILTSRGAVKYIRGIARAIEQIAGRPLFIGALQDITESKIAEEALDRARSELAHVARVTTLNALTASIAHEINQPLASLITNASICLRRLNANPPNVEGARETATRTIRDGNRASDVISRLRALYSKKEFTPEPLDLNEATQEVIAMSLSDLQRNAVILRSELANGLPLVSGDRVQLQQVILNLVRNASDAMGSVDDRPRELLIRTEQEAADRVRFSVKDAGIGFTGEVADKLFQAFYTTKHDGMGIGLHVSRSIIEAHHGRLWASANDGPGATFSFAIPCRPTGLDDIQTRSTGPIPGDGTSGAPAFG